MPVSSHRGSLGQKSGLISFGKSPGYGRFSSNHRSIAARELTEFLLERSEEIDIRGNTIVSVSLGGQISAIRVSRLVESLQALEDLNGQIGASPRVQQLTELISAPAIRSVARITYLNQP